MRTFLSNASGAISLDWVVLTAVIVGTGFSVINSMPGGLETAATGDAGQLRGQVVQRSFGPDDLCAHGIDGLKAREAARVGAGGRDPVDISGRLSVRRATLGDDDVRRERFRTPPGSSRNGDWDRDSTIRGLVDCDYARRGLD